MSRWKPLPTELEPTARQLVIRLRRLKDRTGLSLARLAERTGYSAKSWERYLGGRSLPPPEAVRALLAAKGRGREMPPPVLVSAASTLDALAVSVPTYARALVDAFWPGPLTLVCHQQSSLQWDLGDTRGTVAVRMPDHPVARELLERTGPLAVSSANRHGQPPAQTAAEARDQLGDDVAVYLEDGAAAGGVASTIVDLTGPHPCILRLGAIGEEALLGNGSTMESHTPQPVTGLSLARGLGLGGRHACSFTDDETTLCWGGNSNGQIGDNSTVDRRTPTQAAPLTCP